MPAQPDGSANRAAGNRSRVTRHISSLRSKSAKYSRPRLIRFKSDCALRFPTPRKQLRGSPLITFGLLGIEPSLYPPEGYVLPVYYSPRNLTQKNPFETNYLVYPDASVGTPTSDYGRSVETTARYKFIFILPYTNEKTSDVLVLSV